MTENTGTTFTVKESANGDPWIMLEPDEPGLQVLERENAFIGLRFRKGVTLAEAEAFAAQMRHMLDVLTYTTILRTGRAS